ncbi:hypothetical protein QBC99_003447 [Beijerinckia sp. GAS462]|nr:hypothetical protein [Beijerinckia sp. GAS462]SEC83430.1 hypothetical protein SAMN05443249_3678 [Beijerinckia sp. 28-YEA-48]
MCSNSFRNKLICHPPGSSPQVFLAGLGGHEGGCEGAYSAVRKRRVALPVLGAAIMTGNNFAFNSQFSN